MRRSVTTDRIICCLFLFGAGVFASRGITGMFDRHVAETAVNLTFAVTWTLYGYSLMCRCTSVYVRNYEETLPPKSESQWPGP